MPLVRVEIGEGWPEDDKAALLPAVHAALVEAFEIPEDDRDQRLVELDRDHLEVPPGRGARSTLIEITAFPGRSIAAKRRLYAAIVRNLGTLHVPAADILVVVHEPPLENWGLQGGRSADEVDLGLRLDV